MDSEQQTKKPPIKKFKVGNVSANIWEREIEDGKVFHNVSLERSYKDEDGNWKSSNSFGLEDFSAIQLVMRMAGTFLEQKIIEAHTS